KLRATLLPNLCVLDLLTLIKKQPSPETNPANQYLTPGVLQFKVVLGTRGFGSGITLVKAAINLSGKPLLRVALILISLVRPALVRCSLFFTMSKAFLNNKKSAYFLVFSG
ncbi:hypothetical protein HOY82DRAFT_495492, partial [Tuber indicum]